MIFIKKHIKLIVLLIVLAVTFSIYKVTNYENINYTALGDGFSLGINSYGEINYGYSDYIRDYLQKENKLNYYIKDFSTPTMSIENLYENIVVNKKVKISKKELNIKQTLRESNIITLSVGINDLIYRISTTENMNEKKLDNIINEISESLDLLLTEIRKYYPYEIYVVGYYYPNTSNIYLQKGLQKLNELYNEKENIVYISTTDIIKSDSNYLSNPNSIYPNNAGYKAISDKIILKISKKLEKR